MVKDAEAFGSDEWRLILMRQNTLLRNILWRTHKSSNDGSVEGRKGIFDRIVTSLTWQDPAIQQLAEYLALSESAWTNMMMALMLFDDIAE